MSLCLSSFVRWTFVDMLPYQICALNFVFYGEWLLVTAYVLQA